MTTQTKHPAGYHAIKKCLEVQGPIADHSGLAKFFGISPLTKDSTSWYKGALGEIEVGERLESLGSDWLVLHSVPIGTRGSDIDHIVVGRAGVFTINTKRHRHSNVWVADKSLMVNGQKQPYIRNSEFEAERVKKALVETLGFDMPVTPVLAIQSKTLTIKKEPDTVIVVEGNWLNRRLKNRKKVLSDEQFEQLSAVVEDPATWGIALEDPTEMLAKFQRLKKQDGHATVVKMLWLGGSGVLGLWAASAILPNLLASLMGV